MVRGIHNICCTYDVTYTRIRSCFVAIASGRRGFKLSCFALLFAGWRLRERLRPVRRGDMMDAVVVTIERRRRSGRRQCGRRRGVAERGLNDARQNHFRDGTRTRVGHVVTGGSGERGTRRGDGGTRHRTRTGRVVVCALPTHTLDLFDQFGGGFRAARSRGLRLRRWRSGKRRRSCMFCEYRNRKRFGHIWCRTRSRLSGRVARASVGVIVWARGGREIGEREGSGLELLLAALHRRYQRRQAEPAPLVLDHCKSRAMNKKPK